MGNVTLECAADTKDGGNAAVCCCNCCFGNRFRAIFAVLNIILGIADIVLEWIAFRAFAVDDFRTSPLGDPNNDLLIGWLCVLVPSTILTIVDVTVLAWLLYGTISGTSGSHDLEGDGLTWHHVLSTCKVIVEDGGNIGLAWYIIFWHLSTEDVDDNSVSGLLFVSIMAIIVYNVGSRERLADIYLDGDEGSLYLQSSDFNTFSPSETLLVNFSDIYSNKDKETKQYIYQRDKGCQVYHLRFDSVNRVIRYKHAVFWPACYECTESDSTNPTVVSDICNEKVQLELKLYYNKKRNLIYNDAHNKAEKGIQQCISEKSRYAKYESTLSPCNGTTAAECYQQVLRKKK